jgi:hypothetical protein
LEGGRTILEGFMLKIKGQESGVPIRKRQTKRVERGQRVTEAPKSIALGLGGLARSRRSVKGPRNAQTWRLTSCWYIRSLSHGAQPHLRWLLAWFSGRIVAQGWRFQPPCISNRPKMVCQIGRSINNQDGGMGVVERF